MPTERQKEVAQELPEEQREVFHDLVEDYKKHSKEQTGRAFVSYKILVQLVADGWRKLDEHVEGEG